MNITPEKKEEILKKKDNLVRVTKKLKQEFVGLDDVIDELINDIQTWYLFPEGQIRPTIINLWGLTGVGKTSLVQTLFKHLELSDELYKFNVGDYAGESDTKLSYVFSNELKQKEKMPIGIMFDEFQLGRTLDENGAEIQKSGLRTIWDILDSGMLQYLDYNWYGGKIMNLTFLLEKCNQLDVEIRKGIVYKKIDDYKDVFNIREVKHPHNDNGTIARDIDDDDDDDIDIEYVRVIPENFIITDEYMYALKACDPKTFYSDKEIVKFFGKFDSIEELIDYLNDLLKKLFKPRLYDYTKSIVFIIGNLDEAYEMTSQVSPDSDADFFHKHSLSIKLGDIKESLKTRFRVEQIGRLGNNHIIYRAFSSQTYRDLIKLELNRINKKMKTDYGINISFDKSVNEIVYKEGVFPTLGTRPVFTTINTLIESALSKILLDIALNDTPIDNIKWSFVYDNKNSCHVAEMFNDGKHQVTKQYDAKLKLEVDRKSTGDEKQLLVATHESGHAVLSILEMNIIPDSILSKTSGGGSNGFCSIDIPDLKTKEWYRRDIIVCFGGMIAEKMVFGDDFMSDGSSGDLERITQNALYAAQKFGMLNENLTIGVENVNQQYSVYKNTKDSDIEARNWINSCYNIAKKTLENNKELLYEFANILKNKSKIEKPEIIEILKKLNYDIPNKDMNNFYGLYEKFEEFLKK